MCGAETGERSAHNWQYDASLPVVFTCSMLVLSLRMQTKLRECQNLGRIAATNARRLEGGKVALQAALGAQEEAGRRDRAQLEAQLNVARRELRELEERMARVRAATEL